MIPLSEGGFSASVVLTVVVVLDMVTGGAVVLVVEVVVLADVVVLEELVVDGVAAELELVVLIVVPDVVLYGVVYEDTT